MNEWYTLTDPDEIDSPALVVYPDRVRQNIGTLISMVDDTGRLRPHVKTHKSAEVTGMLLDAGITKFKCATIAEAELLGRCGAPDVLLAYQPAGPKLRRFLALIRQYPATRFSCLVDHPQAARQMSAVFAAAGLQLPVYIDLNTGMNRTGILPGEAARNLYHLVHHLDGMTPKGLHAYDGHLRQADPGIRTAACNLEFEAVTRLCETLSADGLEPPVIIAGGSPTFSIHAGRKTVECSPGTFVYWDKGYMEMCAEQHFIPAALLLSRVISLPDETRICVDLGHKSVAAENELAKRIFFLNAPELVPLAQNEEHLVLEAGEGHPYLPGDVLYGLPMHICPTVALFESVFTAENGRLTGSWKNVARDRSIGL